MSLKHHLLKSPPTEQSIFFSLSSSLVLPISLRRKEKKKKVAWRVSHTDVTSSRPFCLLCYLLSLSSPLFLFLLPQPTPIYFAHILSSLCYYEKLLLQGISYPAFLSMGPKQRFSSLGLKPHLCCHNRSRAAFKNCCSFDYDRLRAATCWNRRTVLLTLLWFWHTSCWLAAKTRSGVKTSEKEEKKKKKACLSEIVMLKPGDIF